MLKNQWRRLSASAAILIATLAGGALIHAQGQSGFVAVPGGQITQEQLPAAPLVFAAYAFVWVVLVVYIFLLWRRLDRVERELADVTRKAEARHS